MNSMDDIFKDNIQLPNKSTRVRLTEKMITGGVILFSIALFEVLVCILGTKFYTSMGYDFSSGLILAVTIEVFYMYFSSRKSWGSMFIKIVLLLVSISALTYSAYIKDQNVQNSIIHLDKSLQSSYLYLKLTENSLLNLKKIELSIEKDMKSYRDYDLITKGNRVLKPRRDALAKKRELLIEEKNKVLRKIKITNNARIDQGIISNIWILSMKTIMSILTFTILQISICVALPDVLDSLRGES
jgi:hypothetical protein